MKPSAQDRGGRIRIALLAAGALLGLLWAASELVERADRRTAGLPDGVVARVGGRDIHLSRYQAVLGDLAADRRNALTAEDRAFALQRLVDEELLVLEGLRAGLAESLPEVRKALAAAVIAQTVAEAEAVKPSERQLRELYDSDAAFFTRTAQYRVVWLRGPVTAVRDTAPVVEAAAQLKAGADAESVASALGLERARELPDAPLPRSRLQDFLGAELANAVSSLEPGMAAGPLQAGDETHVLYLAGYLPPELPPFERIESLVEAEFTRRQGDAAVQRQLERLRRENEIIVDPGKLE
jgi:parvulin-like peptidyl-prolyl isomerase